MGWSRVNLSCDSYGVGFAPWQGFLFIYFFYPAQKLGWHLTRKVEIWGQQRKSHVMIGICFYPVCTWIYF